MQSTPPSSASGDSPAAPRELPWAVLERNLVLWLAALQTSAADGDAGRVWPWIACFQFPVAELALSELAGCATL